LYFFFHYSELIVVHPPPPHTLQLYHHPQTSGGCTELNSPSRLSGQAATPAGSMGIASFPYLLDS